MTNRAGTPTRDPEQKQGNAQAGPKDNQFQKQGSTSQTKGAPNATMDDDEEPTESVPSKNSKGASAPKTDSKPEGKSHSGSCGCGS